MTEELRRQVAIQWLCEAELEDLSLEKRGELLLDWWHVDEEDPEFASLPDSLKSELGRADIPDDVTNSRFDVLLLIAMSGRYRGVSNEYLAERLRAAGLGSFQIKGEPEVLFQCPCCEYRTLDSRGEYEICPVCFWEDTGDIDQDRYSGPNHMTLREARANFMKLGAISLDCRQFVDPDGIRKWSKANGGRCDPGTF
jgi:hypothetical protein